MVNWQPAHFYGDLWLHGKVALSAFGFGIGLTADAKLAADVFDPFHIIGSFRVAIDLPWPFDDIGATVKLEWGPEKVLPEPQNPLKEAGVGHDKSTTVWPLELTDADRTDRRVGADRPARRPPRNPVRPLGSRSGARRWCRCVRRQRSDDDTAQSRTAR